MAEERLQKILARAGVASRRKCEELIAAGRVTVDGRTVTQMGTKADVKRQEIRFDGRRITSEKKVYYLLNKPRGVVCTNEPVAVSDGKVPVRAIDLLPNVRQRLFTVGRLDMDSEGLLILTNDGEFANRIAHPRYEVSKTYVVDVEGEMNQSALERLESGVELEGEWARVLRARLLRRSGNRSRVEVTLKEGRKRQIRHMLEAIGFSVTRLNRTRIGSLRLGELATGQYRELTPAEVRTLLSCTRTRAKDR